MYTITLSADIPKDESFVVYVDGKPCEGPAFTVNGRFHIKLEQFRLSAAEGSGKRNLLAMLAILLARGGRITYGSEISTPDRAVWEAECEALADGEIKISLARQDDGTVLFDVGSVLVTFTDIKTARVAESEEKRRWLGLVLPILIPMSLFLIAMIVIIWAGTQDSKPGPMIDMTRIVFTVLPGLGFIYIWYMTLKPLCAKKKPYDKEKHARRYERMATFLNVLAAIYAIVAAAELLLPAIWGIDWVYFAPLPCTFVFIITMVIAANMNDNVGFERGETREAAESMKKAMKRAIFGYAAAIVFEIVSLMAFT